MNELAIWQQALGGSLGAGALIVAVMKAITFFRKEQESQAGIGATTAQFKALQEQITQAQVDIAALRTLVGEMDKTIHKQQRTITRMEMLLRQFSSLVQEKGITVPAHMQAELDALIVSNEERAMVVGEQLLNRRATDK